MDVRYVNPFVRAVRRVFATMLKTEVAVQKPRVKTDGGASADVAGVIGFSGDAAGCVVLSFPNDVAVKVAGTLVGAAVAPEGPDVVDAIGELANMVAGNAKKDFEGVQVRISAPSVITGQDRTVSQSLMSPRLVIPCSSALGDFCVEVAMKVDKPAAAVEGATA